tara:strand:+ start:2816 stop:3019 length:204 start_codon:yes stop_codon:yes gene_type:complete
MLDGFIISLLGCGFFASFIGLYLSLKNIKKKNYIKIYNILEDSKKSFRKNHYKIGIKRLGTTLKYLT